MTDVADRAFGALAKPFEAKSGNTQNIFSAVTPNPSDVFGETPQNGQKTSCLTQTLMIATPDDCTHKPNAEKGVPNLNHH